MAKGGKSKSKPAPSVASSEDEKHRDSIEHSKEKQDAPASPEKLEEKTGVLQPVSIKSLFRSDS